MREETADSLSFREAAEADSGFLFDLRNDDVVRATSRNTGPLDRDAHERWVAETVAAADRVLYVVERDGEPIGTVRFDIRGDEGEISIALMPDARGDTGWRVVQSGTQRFLAAHSEVSRCIGEHRLENEGGRGVARKSGYRPTGETRTPGFEVVAYERGQQPAPGEPGAR